MELTILITTINEAENLKILLPRLLSIFSDVSFEILIIDGNSIDGTVEVAKSFGCRVEEQLGPNYGSAIIQGIKSAKGKYLIVMDADCSHTAEAARNLFNHRYRADIVINSRYMPGGGTKTSKWRGFSSRVINYIYRKALKLPFYEISGGFRIYRKNIFSDIKLLSSYYEIQEELLILPYLHGYKILEIPYTYESRKKGDSKAKFLKYGVYLLLALKKFKKIQMLYERDQSKSLAQL